MKIMFFILSFFSISFGYVTSTNGGFQVVENKLIYDNNAYIDVDKHGVITSNLNIYLKPFQFKYKQEKLQVDCFTPGVFPDNNGKCYQNVKIPIIEFNKLFSYLMFNNVLSNSDIYLKIKNKLYKGKIKIEDIKYSSKVFGNLNSVEKIVVQLDDYEDSTPFVLYKYQDLPLEFTIQSKNYKLTQIIDKYVKQYNVLKKQKPISLDNFDFTKEKIWATFKATTPQGIRYLKASFEMEDSQNSLFLFKLSGSGLILEPKKNNDEDYEINAYIVDMGKDEPYEYRKELKINKEAVLVWQQEEPGNVALIYKDEDDNQRQKGVISSKSVFDINGVWYLITWLDKMGKNSYSFSYLDIGRLEGKIKKEKKSTYLFTAGLGGNSLWKYRFVLDKHHRIISIKDLKNRVSIELNGVYVNATIQKNIKYLKAYLKNHNLKVINEK